MKIRYGKTIFFIFAVQCLIVPSIWASGMGLCLTYSDLGNLDLDSSYFDDWSDEDATDPMNASLGFIYDSNLSTESPFNYRMEVLVLDQRRFEFDYKDSGTAENEYINLKISGMGLKFNNDLGLGMRVSDSIRIWAGLELSLGLYRADSQFLWHRYSPDGDDWEENATGTIAGFGAGAVFGVNFNAKDGGTFPVKISYSVNQWECSCLPNFINGGSAGVSEEVFVITIGLMSRKNEAK